VGRRGLLAIVLLKVVEGVDDVLCATMSFRVRERAD